MPKAASKKTVPTWKIGFADAKKRLDVFLTEKLDGLSRAQAKKQVEAGAYAVNGKRVSGHHFLKEGDVVAAEATIPAPAEKKSYQTPSATKSERDIKMPPLEIIKETPDWIVIKKPAGILMHPDHDHTEGTLIDAVIAHAPQVAKVGEDPGRPGIVSRLDKDVSGLVVIAKTQNAFDDLKRQFAEHSVTKEYVALVHGDITKDEGDLKFRIARSTSKARMAASAASSEGGQAAWTHYTVERRFTGATLLRLQILTGRTHQIRAHLHAFSHPVIGDVLYKLKQTKRNIAAPRVMLQSVKLAFTDLKTGDRVTFESPLDPEFDRLIATL
jgi:23S rRNA pseudouridine1911/1915/1917 synthase